MAVKITVEGTGRWVSLPRGVRRTGLLTPRVEAQLRRGLVVEVDRHEIPDVDPPVRTVDQPVEAIEQVEQAEPVRADPLPEPEPEPGSKARRPRRARAEDADG